MNEKHAKKTRELNLAFKHCFESEDGKLVMEWLQEYKANFIKVALDEKIRDRQCQLINQASGVDGVILTIENGIQVINALIEKERKEEEEEEEEEEAEK